MSWLDKEIHLLPAKWRLGKETKDNLRLSAGIVFVVFWVFALILALLQEIPALLKKVPAEVWLLIAIFFGSILVIWIAWTLLLFVVRGLGRAWRNE
jgi:hypothetical protein